MKIPASAKTPPDTFASSLLIRLVGQKALPWRSVAWFKLLDTRRDVFVHGGLSHVAGACSHTASYNLGSGTPDWWSELSMMFSYHWSRGVCQTVAGIVRRWQIVCSKLASCCMSLDVFSHAVAEGDHVVDDQHPALHARKLLQKLWGYDEVVGPPRSCGSPGVCKIFPHSVPSIYRHMAWLVPLSSSGLMTHRGGSPPTCKSVPPKVL